MKRVRGFSFYVILFVITALIIMLYSNISNPTVMKYSDFRRELNNGNVKNVLVQPFRLRYFERASEIFTDYRYSISFLSQESFMEILDKAFDEGNFRTMM